MRGKYHFIDGKFITFDLNREEYAIALERVLEIVGPGEISDTDHDDPCVRGVVKVRDLKVPVLDLYCRFGLAARADKEGSSVLVAVLGRALSKVGLLVDSVRQVTHIRARFIENPPAVAEGTWDGFILGQVLVEGRTVVILNLDKWEPMLLAL